MLEWGSWLRIMMTVVSINGMLHTSYSCYSNNPRLSIQHVGSRCDRPDHMVIHVPRKSSAAGQVEFCSPPRLSRSTDSKRNMLEAPVDGWTVVPAGSLSGSPASLILCQHPMLSIWSLGNPLECSGLTSDKQNQQSNERVRQISKVSKIKFSNFQNAD